MTHLRKLRREIRLTRISIAKFFRGLRHSMGSPRIRQTPQDRIINKVVKSLLERDDSHVFFSPISSKVYVHSEDRSIIIIFDLYTISMTNHKFFFTSSLKEGMGEEIFKIAKEKIEKEMKDIEREVRRNEMDFLCDVYENFSKSKDKKDISRNFEIIEKDDNIFEEMKWRL